MLSSETLSSAGRHWHHCRMSVTVCAPSLKSMTPLFFIVCMASNWWIQFYMELLSKDEWQSIMQMEHPVPDFFTIMTEMWVSTLKLLLSPLKFFEDLRFCRHGDCMFKKPLVFRYAPIKRAWKANILQRTCVIFPVRREIYRNRERGDWSVDE